MVMFQAMIRAPDRPAKTWFSPSVCAEVLLPVAGAVTGPVTPSGHAAPAACEWSRRDELHIGRDEQGRPACVVLLDAPTRLKDARRMLAA